MIKISPSVLASDFARLGEEIAGMERAGADMIHLDVMDGVFVPNISFGAPVIKRLRPCAKLFFDAHLMITDPLRYIDDYADAGANGVTFHLESRSDAAETIRRIRSRGMTPALSVKPGTPVERLTPYLHLVGMVLIMTVEPGFGGQAFMPAMLPKLDWLAGYRQKNALAFEIQVDGGIDPATAPLVCAHGADNLVAGSALFSKPDYAAAISGLRLAAGLGEKNA
jgi:ribulose-phosphate 3-epimerase